MEHTIFSHILKKYLSTIVRIITPGKLTTNIVDLPGVIFGRNNVYFKE